MAPVPDGHPRHDPRGIAPEDVRPSRLAAGLRDEASWAIDNKITIYIVTIFITIMGIKTYNSLPKEQFPDITVPTIFISTVNGGNSPTNIENTITKPIEKRLKSISGLKKFTSTSLQDV
jgi:multidrug efflux pump subunit AcrB